MPYCAGPDVLPMLMMPLFSNVPWLTNPCTAEPLILKTPWALIVSKPSVCTVTDFATAPAALITGLLVKLGIVTSSAASGMPADQLTAVFQAVPRAPVQVVWEYS